MKDFSDPIVTLRGGPVDGRQYRVPATRTQIVIAEVRETGGSVAATGTLDKAGAVKHVYEAQTVLQGGTVVYEYFYKGVLNEQV